MTQEFELFGNRIAVKKMEREKTKGGIELPDTADKKLPYAEVVRASSDLSDKDLVRFGVGNIVIYPWAAGIEIEIDQEEFLILDVEEVMGRLL